MSKNEWVRQVGRALGQVWDRNDCVGRIYDSFESLQERRMSLVAVAVVVVVVLVVVVVVVVVVTK